MSSSTRLVRGVTRSVAEGILVRLAAAAVAVEEVDAETDFRLGILEGEGCEREGRGAVIVAFVDEPRRLGGMVVQKRALTGGGRVWNINRLKSGFSGNLRECGFA